MKKKNGTSAGIPRPSGERNSPVGNGNANREVRNHLIPFPPLFLPFVFSSLPILAFSHRCQAPLLGPASDGTEFLVAICRDSVLATFLPK